MADNNEIIVNVWKKKEERKTAQFTDANYSILSMTSTCRAGNAGQFAGENIQCAGDRSGMHNAEPN